jgi:hypothetical protein
MDGGDEDSEVRQAADGELSGPHRRTGPRRPGHAGARSQLFGQLHRRSVERDHPDPRVIRDREA